jgi:hypothetical protein
MIDRYYEILLNNKNEVGKTKIEALTHFLTGFSFDDIYNEKELIGVDHKTRTASQNMQIEKMKAQVRLYLTIAYIAVKNLVKANARYYIAFTAFDRDYALFADKLKEYPQIANITASDGKTFESSFALTEYFLQKDKETRYTSDPKLSDVENKKLLYLYIKEHSRHFDNHCHNHDCPRKEERNVKDNKVNVLYCRDCDVAKRWNDMLTVDGKEAVSVGILPQSITEAKAVHETGRLETEARNNAEHLNVLTALPKYIKDFDPPKMTSYFQLYHFVLQRRMCDPQYPVERKLEMWNLGDLPEKLNRYHTPCEDFIKIAYVSLAYNLPRYKNLTIEALFDDDSDTGKELQKKCEEKEKKRMEKQK